MPHRGLLAVLALLAAAELAAGGYALGAAGGDDGAPRIKRFVVPGSTDQDPTRDKG